MKNLVSLFCLILFVNASCSKDEAIPTGNDTFSCRINGKLFLPESSAPLTTIGPTGNGLSFEGFNNQLDLSISAYNNPNEISIYIKNHALGVFNLTKSNGVVGYPASDQKNQVTILYDGKKYLSKDGSGAVIITELTATELKGTFEFILYNESNNNDIIRVTEGKFDN